MITRSNIIARLNDVCIDANNPLADASSIPTDGSNLSTLIDIGFKNYRNTFTQSTSAVQPVYKHNIINGNNAILWDGDTTYMICPYDAVKNSYRGAMTITIAAMSNADPALVTHNCVLGVDSFTDGFTTGIEGTSYSFTSNGISDDVSNPGFVIQNIWQIFSIRANNINNVDFFKNGALVDSQPADPMSVDISDMILGGFNSTLTGFNWGGYTNIIGWSWRAQTDAEIIAQHNYGLGRLGI